MEESKFVWIDGEVVPWHMATTHVLSHGLQYGAGIFEGIRCYPTEHGPMAFRLTDHMRRLQRSGRVYMTGSPYSIETLVDAAKLVVRENGFDECYVRPFFWLGFGRDPLSAPIHTAIACWPWDSYLGKDSDTTGVRVKISSYRRIDANAIPPAAKATGQYLNSFLAKIEALTSGYDEAVLLNSSGFVSDGSGENVFVVRDGVLTTPPTSAGALDGITRASITDIARNEGYQVVEANMQRTDLYLADEVFLTGTAAEIIPVVSVDDRPVDTGLPGPIATRLREVFAEVVRGRRVEYMHWLERVNP